MNYCDLKYVLNFSLKVIKDNNLEEFRNDDNWTIGDCLEEQIKAVNEIQEKKEGFTYDDSVIFIDEEYGYSAEILHKDFRGFHTQTSGRTKEEAIANAQLIKKALEK